MFSPSILNIHCFFQESQSKYYKCYIKYIFLYYLNQNAKKSFFGSGNIIVFFYYIRISNNVKKRPIAVCAIGL